MSNTTRIILLLLATYCVAPNSVVSSEEFGPKVNLETTIGALDSASYNELSYFLSVSVKNFGECVANDLRVEIVAPKEFIWIVGPSATTDEIFRWNMTALPAGTATDFAGVIAVQPHDVKIRLRVYSGDVLLAEDSEVLAGNKTVKELTKQIRQTNLVGLNPN